jgi:hypothetical protein
MGDPSETQHRHIERELFEYAARKREDGPYADNLDLDVLVVGAGFGTSLCSKD